MMILPTEKGIDWKRPPLVLFSLVLINILVFAFYQSDDERLLQSAVEIYQSEGLPTIERSAYEAYNATLDVDKRVELDDQWLVWHIITDQDFTLFLEENYRAHIRPEIRNKWRLARQQVEDNIARLSYNAYGLEPFDISLVTVLTYQFLHSDISHLLGNMVFLLLTGFAVEAALGQLRFVTYYLVSGIGAGLLFSFVQVLTEGGSAGLIGASGAVSGVMAMYVSLFKFRKIEFFYWFFIFTGYFRAAAVIILPAYILKEVYMLLMYEGSNVAYVAHIGGFIVGGALVLATQLIRHKAIDTKYLESTEEPVDPYRQAMHKLYLLIGACEFRQAWKSLTEIEKQFPRKKELIDIKYNLLRALNRDKAELYLMQLLGRNITTPHISRAQASSWQALDPKQKDEISFENRAALINNLLGVDLPHIAEKVFSGLKSSYRDYQSSLINEGQGNIEGEINARQNKHNENKNLQDKDQLAMSARKIALYYQQLGRDEISENYNSLAKEIMLNSSDTTKSAGVN